MQILTQKTMSLFDTIQNDVKEAMKAKDTVRLTTLRSILAAFKNAKVAGNGEPTEEDYMTLIQKQAKQRKESIAQFDAAGRDDLSANEKAELAIIEAYLPEMMSKEEVIAVAKETMEELGISEKSDMGKLMGALMGKLKGKADGGMVKDVAGELLS